MSGRDNGFCNSYGCLLIAIREMIANVMTLACHSEVRGIFALCNDECYKLKELLSSFRQFIWRPLAKYFFI